MTQISQKPDTQTSKPLALSGISFKRRTTSKVMSVLIYLSVAVALVPLLWLMYELVSRGAATVLNPEWWGSSQLGVMYTSTGGGALHAIIGSFVQVGIAAAISIPIGVFTAIYLVEYSRGGKLGQITTFMVDILSGVPSIVAALFVYSFWIVLFGFERSGMAVAISLVLLMIPVVVRNTEEMLRIVPMELREASYALGVPKWKTILRVVVPTALSGIVTGIMLAIARVMGESAPVLILVGATQAINWDAMHGPQASLPLMMLDMYKAGTSDAVLAKLWGAALTLVLIIVALNVAARAISAKFSVKH